MIDTSTSTAEVSAAGPLLLERADADLYRTNGFRLTGMPVAATQRDARRVAERLRVAEKLKTPWDGGRLLPLGELPDATRVREALERLRDPARRLVDECLWLWPQDSRGDGAALEALGRGDISAAENLWRGEAELGDGEAAHNLAVLFHARALDLESAPREQRAADAFDLAAMWVQAFRWWARVISEPPDDGFWRRVRERVDALDEPRLGSDPAGDLRATLPLALASVNAKLAVAAAQRDHGDDAARHLRILRASPLEEDVVDDALRAAITPLEDRIRGLCKSSRDEADADGGRGADAARRLIGQTRPLLAAIDAVLWEGHPTREGLHDEIGLAALACQIAYGNSTEDWDRSLEVLREAVDIVATDTARTRLQENVDIVEENSLLSTEQETCWFCKANPAEATVSHELKMHGDVTRTPIAGGTSIRWRTTSVSVPRCRRCYARSAVHKPIYVALAVLLGCLSLGSCGAVLAAPEGASPPSVAGISTIVLFIAFGVLAFVANAFADHIDDGRSTTFPPVLRMIERGWSPGTKPSDAN